MSSSAWAADSIFNFTGADQSYVVPAGVTTIRVRAWGAGGWGETDPNRPDGGGGAFVTGLLSVTPGETLTIVVGGAHDRGGFGGGGVGAFSNPTASYASGGGGRSAIRRGGTDIVTSAGGGGAGQFSGSHGGGGGLAIGAAGGGASSSGGSGGTQAAGGAGGVETPGGTSLGNGQAGSSGNGGSGGGGVGAAYGGGGGGGGYYGGGGGAGDGSVSGGGGGGSSYLVGLTNTTGSEAGSGRTPGGMSDSFYVAGIGRGYQGGTSNAAGNGRVVILTVGEPNPGQIILGRGDAVPGAGSGVIPAGAKFASFGIPAVSDTGAVSYLASWTGPFGKQSGIFAGGTAVAVTGGLVPGAGTDDLPENATFHAFKDPVPGAATGLSFLATIRGMRVNASNDGVIASDVDGTGLNVVAREGSPAAETDGAIWKSFTSLAMPGSTRFGPVFLGKLVPGRGGISARNDIGLWVVDGAGEVRLLIQEADQVGDKTVKKFTVLNAVSGSPSQTRAFNNEGVVVLRVSFTDGSDAILRLAVP